MKGATGSTQGVLELADGRLSFTATEHYRGAGLRSDGRVDEGGQLFEAPLSEVSEVRWPWYYFGGGVKLKIGDQKYRLSFVKPGVRETQMPSDVAPDDTWRTCGSPYWLPARGSRRARMFLRTPSRFVVALTTLSMLAVAGCGSLDESKVEDGIKRELGKLGADLRSVECPQNVEMKRGGTFNCTAIGTDDTRLAVPVTQRDDKGNVDFRVSVLSPKVLEDNLKRISEAAAVAGGAKKTTAAATRCPELTAPKPGESVVCSLTFDDGSTGLGHLKLDAEGKPEVAPNGKYFDWELGKR